MAPDNSLEMKRLRIERDQAQIAGETDEPTADRVSQRSPHIKRFRDRNHEHRREQRKPAYEDKPETHHNVECTLIDQAITEIAEFRKQHRADDDHSRNQRCCEKSEQNDEQAADQCHEVEPGVPSLLASASEAIHQAPDATHQLDWLITEPVTGCTFGQPHSRRRNHQLTAK